LLIEDSPISHGLIQSLQESRIYVVTFRPDRDKRARVISQSDLFEGGSVFFPDRAPWLEDFENELLAFPGRQDDQVDALIQGITWQREGSGIVQSARAIGCFIRMAETWS
jgi:predicted phage terminase large subunit-like protein